MPPTPGRSRPGSGEQGAGSGEKGSGGEGEKGRRGEGGGGSWCRANDLDYALAGFSAAWRLAAEVRYAVAAVYVDDRGFDRAVLDKLAKYKGGQPVDTGANLLLWRPFDRSVLANSSSLNTTTLRVTSAIQTYLDLKKLAGRGEEAAAAVYARLLMGPLRAAAERNEEMRHAEL